KTRACCTGTTINSWPAPPAIPADTRRSFACSAIPTCPISSAGGRPGCSRWWRADDPPPGRSLSLGRLPEFHLVPVGVHDPSELAGFVGVGTLHRLDTVVLELREQGRQIVDPVVDHEAGGARTEPLRLALGDMPGGEPPILRLILGPLQDRAPPVF